MSTARGGRLGGGVGEEDKERWSEELRSSVGVVTDLVLPCPHAAGAGAGAVGSLVEVEFDSEEDDEDEREMAAALEVRERYFSCFLCCQAWTHGRFCVRL